MSLPDSYTIKIGAVPAYFDALLNAEAPERFSQKFLEGLGFSSSNDRLLIGILKDLGFLNADGKPTDRYYEFLDKSIAPKVVAEGVREAYSDLFAVNKSAHELDVDDAYNKLRSLYRGEKKDTVVKNIAKTFVALCSYADFSPRAKRMASNEEAEENQEPTNDDGKQAEHKPSNKPIEKDQPSVSGQNLDLKSLQYHINIVLPDTRDQAVYDAIFKSLRDHLG
ncbi:MAG: DUF5343 domain-containing protein [Planctomycetaceae bacterium]